MAGVTTADTVITNKFNILQPPPDTKTNSVCLFIFTAHWRFRGEFKELYNESIVTLANTDLICLRLLTLLNIIAQNKDWLFQGPLLTLQGHLKDRGYFKRQYENNSMFIFFLFYD